MKIVNDRLNALRNYLKAEIRKLIKEELVKIEFHMQKIVDRWKSENIKGAEHQALKDLSHERHELLVEQYMDNMNKILKKKL